MQKKNFEILVQTALTVGLFWTMLKLTPKSALLSFTILYMYNGVKLFLKAHPYFVIMIIISISGSFQ